MRMFLTALLLLGLSACASNPKVRMKNCTKVYDDLYDCDPIPEKPQRDFGRR